MGVVKAISTRMQWHPGLSIFANADFLRAVSDECGWIGGINQSGVLRCILPYTIVRRMGIRMVRFRVETIPLAGDFAVDEEQEFLTSAMVFLRSQGGDVLIPATTNTIFRTYPPGAEAAPYGSYVIDLTQPEEDLWRNISTTTRQNIKTALKDGVHIESGIEHLRTAHGLIAETLVRSGLRPHGFGHLERFIRGLGDNVKIMIAEYHGVAQSCAVYAFSQYCAYYFYAGNTLAQHQGAGKLIHWEAMQLFRKLGVLRYDLVGARINPGKGSKQEALGIFKKRFGGILKEGYLWKYPLRPFRASVYSAGIRLLRGGDIVDHERLRLSKEGCR